MPKKKEEKPVKKPHLINILTNKAYARRMVLLSESIAYDICPNKVVAPDLAADAVALITNKRVTFPHWKAARNYLILTLIHLSNNAYRKEQSETVAKWGASQHILPNENCSFMDSSYMAQLYECLEAVANVFAMLPDKQRYCFLMALYGMTANQLAPLFVASPESVQKTIEKTRRFIVNNIGQLETWI